MKNQGKIILIALAGLVITLGLFLVVLKPTINKISALQKDAVGKKTELKQLEEQIETYKNSQRDLAQAAGKEIISTSLLQRENLQIAVEEVERAAAATGVAHFMDIQDEGTNPKRTAKQPEQIVSGKTFLDEVVYSVNTTSDFTQFVNFLQYLEHLPHFTEVSKISLVASSGSSSNSRGIVIHDGKLTGLVELVFFMQKK